MDSQTFCQDILISYHTVTLIREINSVINVEFTLSFLAAILGGLGTERIKAPIFFYELLIPLGYI